MKQQIRQILAFTMWVTAFAVIAGVFGPGQTFAQTTAAAVAPCTDKAAIKTIGKWARQGQDDLAMAEDGLPKEQYKPVLAKAQKVVELLKQSNPEPIGIQAEVARSIRGDSYTKNGAVRFGVTSRYFGYFCTPGAPGDEHGQIVASGETETVIGVEFNGFSRMLNLDKSMGKGITTVNGEIMFFFPTQAGELKGLALLRPGMNNPPQRDEAVIIAEGNRSPLKPVTREQYLQAYEKLSRGKIKKMQETLQGSAAADEKTFAKIDSNNLLSPELKAQLKAGTLKQTKQIEDSSSKSIKTEEIEIAKIQSAIAQMSTDERQMQAVIGDDWTSLSFVSESEPGSIRLVTIDKSFFDPALPRQTIQLIVAYWNWDEKNAQKTELIRQFKQNFDFEALKQMLGK